MVVDRGEYARRARELHVHHLAHRHGWTVTRARFVIDQLERSGAHGFWEVDPVDYWSFVR